jgi:hypothetical protein
MALLTPTYTCTVSVNSGPAQTVANGTTAISVPVSSTNNFVITLTSTSTGGMSIGVYNGTTLTSTYSGYTTQTITIANYIATAKTVTLKVTQAATATYAATSAVQFLTLTSATGPTITPNATNNGTSVQPTQGATVNMAVTSNSTGAFTYALGSGAPSWATIVASGTGAGTVTLGAGVTGGVSIPVIVSQASAGTYSALYQVSAGSFSTLSLPTITPADPQSVTYSSGLVVKVTPKSSQNTSGAFTYSLGSGAPAGTSIVASTGAVTIGGAGTINVYVTQASSTGWAAVTTPVLAGTITVNQAVAIGTQGTQSVIYAPNLTVDCHVTSANTATPVVYSLAPGYPANTSVNASTGVVTVGGIGTITVLVNQTGSANFLSVVNATAYVLTVTPAATSITFQSTSVVYSVGGTYTAVPVSNNTAGAFSFSLGKAPQGTYIDPTSGVIKLISTGLIQVFITQTSGGNYTGFSVPVEALRITVTQGAPVLTGLGDKTFAWNGLKASMAITSNSSGALTYSLGNSPTPPAGTTIDANTGQITPGDVGSLSVYVNQAASTLFSAISSPVLVGNLTIIPGKPVITSAPLQSIAYAPNEQTVVIASSTNTATPLFYYLISGTNGAVDALGNVTITGTGTLTIGVTQAASGNFLAIAQSDAVVAGVVSVVSGTSVTNGPRFVSPTYLGINRLYVLPEDNLSVQPSRLACLTRKYACAKSYAPQARTILSVGSNPFTGDGSTSVTSWPNMWLFKKPEESTDGVITTFTCQYYGVRDASDFNVIYQVIGSEIRALSSSATFFPNSSINTTNPSTSIPFTAKYVSPIITQTFVQKTSSALNLTPPSLPYSKTNLFEVMVQGPSGNSVPLNALTAGLSQYGTLLLWSTNYDLYPSFISVDQANYGVVTETTLKFGAVISTGQF